jgi:hypothetical protein
MEAKTANFIQKKLDKTGHVAYIEVDKTKQEIPR